MASDPNIDLSKLTGARQTMLSWSKVVESFDSMPEAYKDSYKMALGDVHPFPYVVFAPSIAGIRRKVTGKLICEAKDSIYIWEHSGNQVAMTEYPLKTISDLEVGSILLYSWFTISGMTNTGMASSTTVEFNTATGRHLARFTNKMRPKSADIGDVGLGLEKAKFDYLTTENFKFMNFARESLVRGEKVLKILLQPQICKPIISIGKHVLYQTTISMAHLVVLTDKEIILIQEDERSTETRGVRYGGKWQYISLQHINAVSLMDHSDDLLSLSLTLCPGERRIEILFAASKKQEAVGFQKELDRLII